jgi:hypothetical protein
MATNVLPRWSGIVVITLILVSANASADTILVPSQQPTINHGNDGGAIDADATALPIVGGCTFEENTADQNGGSVVCTDAEFIDCTFTSNGNGITCFVGSDYECHIERSIFAGNDTGRDDQLGGAQGEVPVNGAEGADPCNITYGGTGPARE